MNLVEENGINFDFAAELQKRTKAQAVAIIKFCRNIKSNDESIIIKRQIIRCATSVAANYRSACRGRSRADFISKLGIVHEEADEVVFWLEMMKDLDYNTAELPKLLKESDEICRII